MGTLIAAIVIVMEFGPSEIFVRRAPVPSRRPDQRPHGEHLFVASLDKILSASCAERL
jgi:hypothetical protein